MDEVARVSVWRMTANQNVLLLLAWLSACEAEKPACPEARLLTDARQIVLEFFKKLEAFKLEDQMQAELAGLPALRLQAAWKDGGQGFRGIIYIIEQPSWFNVIYYAAPVENGIFEEGLPNFQKIMRSLRPVATTTVFQVTEEEGNKRLRSGELGLDLSIPTDWIYSLDAKNKAMVLSGPRRERSWLTTVNFSVVHKWRQS